MSKYTPLVSAPELWDARLVASYTVDQLAEQQYRLDHLPHAPSALPPLGAWAQITDLSGLEDMEVDPMHMDPLHAIGCHHSQHSAPCVLPPWGTAATSYGANQGSGGDLAACMRSRHPMQQHNRNQRHQGCFQLRSGRYGRREQSGDADVHGDGHKKTHEAAIESDAAEGDFTPPQTWMVQFIEGARGGKDQPWHSTTLRRFTEMGHRWVVVNSWREERWGTNIHRQKLACVEGFKLGCLAMAMVVRKQKKAEPAERDGEGMVEDLGDDEPMLARFAGTHNHLLHQDKLYNTLHQHAKELVEDHLPLALLGQLRGDAPSSAIIHQHPAAVHPIPPINQQPQTNTPSHIQREQRGNSPALSCPAFLQQQHQQQRHLPSILARCASPSTPSGSSYYSLRTLGGHHWPQVALASCPDVVLDRVQSANLGGVATPLASFVNAEVKSGILGGVEALLRKCDPYTTSASQLRQFLTHPLIKPTPYPPPIQSIRDALLCLTHRQRAHDLALQHTQVQHGGHSGATPSAQQQLTGQSLFQQQPDEGMCQQQPGQGPSQHQQRRQQQQQELMQSSLQDEDCVALPAARLEGAIRRWLEQRLPLGAANSGTLHSPANRASTRTLQTLHALLTNRPPQNRQLVPHTGSTVPGWLKALEQARDQKQQQQVHCSEVTTLNQAENLVLSVAKGDVGSPCFWRPPVLGNSNATHPWSLARLQPVVGLAASDPVAPWGADAYSHAPLPHPRSKLEQQQEQQEELRGGKRSQPRKSKAELEREKQRRQAEEREELERERREQREQQLQLGGDQQDAQWSGQHLQQEGQQLHQQQHSVQIRQEEVQAGEQVSRQQQEGQHKQKSRGRGSKLQHQGRQQEAEEKARKEEQRLQQQMLAQWLQEPSATKHEGVLKPLAVRSACCVPLPVVLLPPPAAAQPDLGVTGAPVGTGVAGARDDSDADGRGACRPTVHLAAPQQPGPAPAAQQTLQRTAGAAGMPAQPTLPGLPSTAEADVQLATRGHAGHISATRPSFRANSVWKRPFPMPPQQPPLQFLIQPWNPQPRALAHPNVHPSHSQQPPSAPDPPPRMMLLQPQRPSSLHMLAVPQGPQAFGSSILPTGSRDGVQVRPSVLHAASVRLAGIMGRGRGVAGAERGSSAEVGLGRSGAGLPDSSGGEGVRSSAPDPALDGVWDGAGLSSGPEGFKRIETGSHIGAGCGRGPRIGVGEVAGAVTIGLADQPAEAGGVSLGHQIEQPSGAGESLSASASGRQPHKKRKAGANTALRVQQQRVHDQQSGEQQQQQQQQQQGHDQYTSGQQQQQQQLCDQQSDGQQLRQQNHDQYSSGQQQNLPGRSKVHQQQSQLQPPPTHSNRPRKKRKT